MDEWIAHTNRVHVEIALNLQGLLRGRFPAGLTGAGHAQEMYVGRALVDSQRDSLALLFAPNG